MITPEAVLKFMEQRTYRPLTLAELSRAMNLKSKERKMLASILEELTRSGKVVQTRTQRFGLPERMNLVVGRLQAHAKGYAFVIPDREDQDDVFIPPSGMGTAMHNDHVIARITVRSGKGEALKAEGEIIRILQRANRRIIGRLESYRKYAYVTPLDPRLPYEIFIPPGGSILGDTGDVVIVEITSWPDRRRNPEGRIVDLLGSEDDPAVGIEVIMFNHGLQAHFDRPVLREAELLPQEVTEDDLAGRADLRQLLTVTIDGADAKDLDDAISLQPGEKGRWRLGVHIADVSHYVQEGSALDYEAFRRGASAYLVDRVIPMLPEALSNGICSLHPGEDRLTISVFIELDAEGRILHHELTPSVIRSHARLTYEGVLRVLNGQAEDLPNKYMELRPLLDEMYQLSQLLFKRRTQRGAINFEFPEPKIILDEQGRAVDVLTEERNIATQIIEEFMILCNEVVAENYLKPAGIGLYRIHEPPQPDTVTEFEKFLALFGLKLRDKPTEPVKPRHFQNLLEQLDGRTEKYLLSTVALRTMERAKYSVDNVGHFGLASPCYTHFTAPIRRYPDLIVHRIVKFIASGSMTNDDLQQRFARSLPEIARHASLAERSIEEAERETIDLKKVEYMEGKLGEVFEGIISGVTNFGFFVQLDNTVEGLVHVSTLADDYYRFEENRYTLVGERTGRTFRIGDLVKVQVVRVDRRERIIDFVLVEDE